MWIQPRTSIRNSRTGTRISLSDYTGKRYFGNATWQAAAARRPLPRAPRIGWLGDFGGAYAYDPEVAELCEQALRVLAAATGGEVVGVAVAVYLT